MKAYSLRELLREFNASRTLRKTFLIHLAVSLFAFMLILAFLTSYEAKRTDEKWLGVAADSLRQAEAINNSYLLSLTEYMTNQLENEYRVRSLIYNSTYTQYQSVYSRTVYEQLAASSQLIKTVQLVNFNTCTVLDNNGRFSFDGYTDSELLMLLQSLTPRHSPYFFYPRQMNASGLSGSTPSSVISMIFYLNKAGALVVNLDAAGYAQMILSAESSELTTYYLVNGMDVIFCSNDNDAVSRNVSGEEILSVIRSQGTSVGSFALPSDPGYTVSYRRGESMSVIYYSITRRAGLFGDSITLHGILLLGIAFLIISLVISVLLSWISSIPIRRLTRHVAENAAPSGASAVKHVDEVEYLGSMYRNIMLSNREMTARSELHRHERERWLLLRLMNPESFPTPVSTSELEEMEASYTHRYYLVVALMPDKNIAPSEAGAHEIRQQMAPIATQILQKLGTVQVAFPLAFQLLFVVNTDEHDRSRLQPVLEEMLAACRRHFSGSRAYMGVGCTVEELDGLSVSYAGAAESLKFACFRQMETVCFAEDMSTGSQTEPAFSWEQEEQLAKAFRHQQQDKVAELLEQFFRRLLCESHSASLRSLLLMDACFQRLENELKLDADVLSDVTVLQDWDLVKVQQYFMHRLQQDMSQMNTVEHSHSDYGDLINKVNTIVQERIFDPGLSVTMLAEEFSFSVNYLRGLYKSMTGETLSNHITQCRIRVICDLLDNTEESIDQISAKMGFSTRNYFFTFFKKHIGMTPTQYRQREKSPEA